MADLDASKEPSSPFNNVAHDRVRKHFLDHDPSAHPGLWDDLWKAQELLLWDRGAPNPAFADVLSKRTDILGSPVLIDKDTGMKRRKRALVPGCGKGYDVVLLASFGYDAYGVEASANAVKACETWAEENKDVYVARDSDVGSGSVKFLFGDFFTDEWVKGVDGGLGEGFDLVYDYTASCNSFVAQPAYFYFKMRKANM